MRSTGPWRYSILSQPAERTTTVPAVGREVSDRFRLRLFLAAILGARFWGVDHGGSGAPSGVSRGQSGSSLQRHFCRRSRLAL